MSKNLIGKFLEKSLEDEKKLNSNANSLEMIFLIISIIAAFVGIILLFEKYFLQGIVIIFFAIINYLVIALYNGLIKSLLNIQRAMTLTMLNTANFDTKSEVELIENSDEKTESLKIDW